MYFWWQLYPIQFQEKFLKHLKGVAQSRGVGKVQGINQSH